MDICFLQNDKIKQEKVRELSHKHFDTNVALTASQPNFSHIETLTS